MNTDQTNEKVSAPETRIGYGPKDAGCYVDGARGIYAPQAIVTFACDHGASILPGFDEFIGEKEAEADTYMNLHFWVDGFYWGRNDQGDWGLWTLEGTIQ